MLSNSCANGPNLRMKLPACGTLRWDKKRWCSHAALIRPVRRTVRIPSSEPHEAIQE
jgi:hypothetical protein